MFSKIPSKAVTWKLRWFRKLTVGQGAGRMTEGTWRAKGYFNNPGVR